MSKKILLIGMLLIALTLGATACQAIPNILAQPTPTSTSTTTPTPTATPLARANPQAPLNRIQGALQLAGLSAGVVSDNKNGTLALRVGRQTNQVQTNAGTLVVMPGKSNSQVADIRDGDRVIADFGDDTTKTTAAFLFDLPSDYTKGNVLLAAVVSSRGGTVNVRARTGNNQVSTSDDTLIVNLSDGAPALSSLADLKPGNLVVAIGQDGNDTFNAQIIVITDRDVRNLLNHGERNQPTPTPTLKPGA